MTTIKATCPTCGEVGLTPRDIDLRVDETGEEESFYAFTCPTCLNRRTVRLSATSSPRPWSS